MLSWVHVAAAVNTLTTWRRQQLWTLRKQVIEQNPVVEQLFKAVKSSLLVNFVFQGCSCYPFSFNHLVFSVLTIMSVLFKRKTGFFLILRTGQRTLAYGNYTVKDFRCSLRHCGWWGATEVNFVALRIGSIDRLVHVCRWSSCLFWLTNFQRILF